MLYFAYGSNLDYTRMQARCPSAEFVGRALLPDYDFCFSRFSKRFQAGVMDIAPSPGKQVWGVVYRLDELDLGRLDQAEGYLPQQPNPDGYFRREYRVKQDGADQFPLTVFAYEINNKQGPFPTVPEYKAHIIKGAREWQLPADYINRLERDITLK